MSASPSEQPVAHVAFVCTGNAARSVMAAAMFEARVAGVRVSGAGTHVIEGLPMSTRTRKALERHGLRRPDHRSRQIDDQLATDVDLLVVMEPGHLGYVERELPAARRKTVLLRRLVALLEGADEPVGLGEVADRFDLGALEATEADEVVDPAGGEQPEFDASADEISDLLDRAIAALAIEPNPKVS